MSVVRFVSANIERSKHLDRVVPFLREQNADVVCLQECMDRDIPLFESLIGPLLVYTPLCVFLARPPIEDEGIYGQAIFSRHPILDTTQAYYAGDSDPLYRFGEDKEEAIARMARALTTAKIQKDATVFQIATTHFTWSKNGDVTEEQTRDLAALFGLLAPLEGFVLTGDFNAPRGRATFDSIAARYKDNIPVHYATSIDGALHRAGPLQLMVDGLFTTPEYIARDVELHAGISDHCAVTATIEKVA